MDTRWICLTHRHAWHGSEVCPVGDLVTVVWCLVVPAIGGADVRLWWEMRIKQRTEAEYLALCELSMRLRLRDQRLGLLREAVSKLGRRMVVML